MVSIALQVHGNSIRHQEDTLQRTLYHLPNRLREMLDMCNFRRVHDRRLRLKSLRNVRHIHYASRQAHHLFHILSSPCHPTARGWLWKLRRIKTTLRLRQSRLKHAHYYWRCPCQSCVVFINMQAACVVPYCHYLQLSKIVGFEENHLKRTQHSSLYCCQPTTVTFHIPVCICIIMLLIPVCVYANLTVADTSSDFHRDLVGQPGSAYMRSIFVNSERVHFSLFELLPLTSL